MIRGVRTFGLGKSWRSPRSDGCLPP